MWRLSFLFLIGSVVVTVWMSFELGLLSFTTTMAAEPKTASSTMGPDQQKKETAEKKDASSLQSLQDSLPAREKALNEREAELTKKARELADKDSTLAGQSTRYEAIIRDLQAKIARLEALNDSKIDAFKKLYEKMETKKVASIFEEMDPPLVAQILGEMKPSMAGEIMSKMPNAKVRMLTEKYLVKRMTASAKAIGQ